MEKMKMESPDMIRRNIDKIAELFPNCITESLGENGEIRRAVQFDLLREMLSGDTVEGSERYEFTWVGKKAALAEANRPTRKTLRPRIEESLQWETTENLYLEGDNLEILKLLQESYLGKIKMIYIDPPYNTGHDFVYPDSFLMDQEAYDAGAGYYDEEGNINYKRENTAAAGRYHSDWCSMMYSRLLLARNLLTEDGILFLSIDDHEVYNLQKIASEIFGSEQYLACFPRVTKKAGKTTEAIARNHDYVLAFSKSSNPAFYLPAHTDEGFRFSDEYEKERGKYKLNQTLDYDSLSYSASLDYPIEIDGEAFYPGQSYEKYLERKEGKHGRADWAWRWSRELFDFGLQNGFVVVKKYRGHSRIYTKTYQNARIVKAGTGFSIEYRDRTRAISTLEFVENEYSNDNAKKNLGKLFENAVFDYSKPVSLIKTLVQYTTRADDLILDFFSGSATTAQAVMEKNAEDGGRRRFILVQLPEQISEQSDAARAGFSTICEIGKERIRRAGAKIREESADGSEMPDTGFRVFFLDESNQKEIWYSPEEISQNLIALMESNIKEDRTALDLLFGCVLEWGLPLSMAHTKEELEHCTVHTYQEGELMACFDENIPGEVIREIARRRPRCAVFRDSSFPDSPSKINVTEIFRMLSPDTRVKVL